MCIINILIFYKYKITYKHGLTIMKNYKTYMYFKK